MAEKEKKEKKENAEKEVRIESVLDLNPSNIWNVAANDIAEMWEVDKQEEDFSNSEEKILNIIRLSFEVVHYNSNDPREVAKYDNGEWALFSHSDAKKGAVAIRKREIKRLSDLCYENIHYISAALLLELIDRNFGGGWDSIQLSMKDIIESAFEISTTTLPSSRLHTPGGTYEKKVAAGFEVLEVSKGNWTEAIFAKKKEVVKKVKDEDEETEFDEDGNPIKHGENLERSMLTSPEFDEEGLDDDDTYYSSYSEEAEEKNEDDEELGGLSLDDEV